MKIDKYSLDDCWEEFQHESDKITENYPKAVYNRDKFLVEVFDPYVSELDLEIRAEPERFDLKRVTDKGIDAVIKKDSHYIKLKKQLLDLEREVRSLKAKGFQVNRDKSSLENLTKLFLHGYYYSDPMLTPKERLKLTDVLNQDQILDGLNDESTRSFMTQRKSKLKLRRKSNE